MTVKEIMSNQVYTIRPDATLTQAACRMDEANVGALAVCEEDRLVGIISDRDIVIRSASAGQDPSIALVEGSMSSPVIYCFEDQSVEDIARIMQVNQVRRLPVLNRKYRLVGLVSVDDIAFTTRDTDLASGVIGTITAELKRAA